MTGLSLVQLGWTESRDVEFAPHAGRGLVPGRISLEHNHVYRVLTEQGEWLAEAAGRLKHEAVGRHALPSVGDWVALRPDPSGARAQVAAVLSRTSRFSRKAAGRETEEQLVAANIDVVLIVFGMDDHVKPRAIERYLIVARRGGAQPVVVLNKIDLIDDLALRLEDARAVASGAPVHAVSTETGAGIETLAGYLAPGKTLALLGPSGAGKSSIVNALMGREVLPTGEVRPWDSRGRHTSVHRQLVVREAGGLIIDTPGMRELQLWDADAVDDTFDDIASLAETCRFRDCRHDREPGCAVKAAVESGLLDASRYDGFLKLQGEREETARKRDERAQIVAKRQGRIGARAMRAFQKDRDKGRH